MHDPLIRDALIVDGTGAPASPRGLHGVWVNGTRIADERGLIRDAARPGRLLRSFS